MAWHLKAISCRLEVEHAQDWWESIKHGDGDGDDGENEEKKKKKIQIHSGKGNILIIIYSLTSSVGWVPGK